MLKTVRLRVFGGGVGVLAFLFSLGVHAVLFVLFSFVHVSGEDGVEGRLEPASISVAQIQKAVSQVPVVPKPMVKRVEVGNGQGKRALEVEVGPRKKAAYLEGDAASFSGQFDGESLAGQFESRPLTEFFGSSTNLRKICYVVDASGSMQGRLGMVVKQLKESIGKLEADQYFYIIFFRGDGLVESGKGVLVRATSKAKSRAYAFIDSIRFEGPTNAVNAIKRSMMIRGSGGESAQQIYFLSDGFDFENEDSPDFVGMVENVRKRLAPSVRINTIGIWVERQDEKILRAIAADSGGAFVGLE
jgi:hypothetical protein